MKIIATNTHDNLRDAYKEFGQALMQWHSGADASRVMRTIREAERHLAAAKERLSAHMSD